MSVRSMFLRRVPLLVAIAIVGCSEPREIAEVEGVLLIHGKPGHKIHIQFIPDVDKGTKGPISMAETASVKSWESKRGTHSRSL